MDEDWLQMCPINHGYKPCGSFNFCRHSLRRQLKAQRSLTFNSSLLANARMPSKMTTLAPYTVFCRHKWKLSYTSIKNKSNLQRLACLSKPKSKEAEFGIYNRIEQQQKPDATGQFKVVFKRAWSVAATNHLSVGLFSWQRLMAAWNRVNAAKYITVLLSNHHPTWRWS